jgi:DNA polymerase-3 subunit gamma/tau
MSYQVLARKWRPHNFTEVVGQQHVVKTLTNALQNNRLHHAYLFTGTRGVGKTTIARILAKAINCEHLQGFNPCGECQVCRDLDAGHFLDLIEVDAASRTKVEDTRDLLDNVQYAPSQGKYKVYLIDEVHMLSGHSFNALLKTLEEPPPHVKFLLATTDPQKIPVTILSRCLQFNLKRLLPAEIIGQFEYILQQENIVFQVPALKQLARAADGSMRDGLSLLDQAIVFGDGEVVTEQVINMLGTVAQQPVEALLKAMADADAAAVLSVVAEIAELSPNFADVLQQLLGFLHKIALLQVIPQVLDHDEEVAAIKQLVALFSIEDVQLFYQIALKGQGDLDLAPDPRSGFEMVMLRMLAFRPVAVDVAKNKQLPLQQSARKQEKSSLSAASSTQAEVAQEQNWAQMISAMKIGGMTRELANNCLLQGIDEKQCILLLSDGHKQLRSARTEEKLQKAIQNLTGKTVKLIIRSQNGDADTETPAVQINKAREAKQQTAVDAVEADENIQSLKDQFDARVIPGSIEPV